MTTTAPRIAIIGSALSGNKGASAMLESSIATLSERIPGVRFTLFSMYPAEDRAQNEYESLDIIDARPRQLGVTINTLALLYRVLPFLRPLLRARSRAIGALADSQVLLDQGGITFTDGREKFLLYNVASILPAMMLRVPVFKCAQAVGPFRNPVNRWSARRFLPRVHTLVTRGRITHEYAEQLGLTNLFAGADYAFSLELDGTEQASAAAHFDLGFFETDALVVGISPSVVLQKKVEARGADYVGEVAGFIDAMTASGRRVVLFPHSVRTGTDKTHNNDLPLCTRIFERLERKDAVLFIDRELSSQTLRYLIGRCDYFVASRFHAMVSSLAMSVPTLVIGWSHKYQEVLEMFQLDEWAFGHDKLEPAFLLERFEALVQAEDQVRERLRSSLPAVKATSLAQADLIAAIVIGSAGARA